MRAMVACVVSTVTASTDQNLDANIPVGNTVTASTVVNSNGVNIPGGSLVAANILAASIAVASMVSVAATVDMATEADDKSPARLCRRTVFGEALYTQANGARDETEFRASRRNSDAVRGPSDP